VEDYYRVITKHNFVKECSTPQVIVSLHTSPEVEEIPAAKVQGVSENRSTDEPFAAANMSC